MWAECASGKPSAMRQDDPTAAYASNSTRPRGALRSREAIPLINPPSAVQQSRQALARAAPEDYRFQRRE